jgi:hypothetical protein
MNTATCAMRETEICESENVRSSKREINYRTVEFLQAWAIVFFFVLLADVASTIGQIMSLGAGRVANSDG